MRSTVRWVVLVGGTAACLAAFSGSAAASTRLHHMLTRYQPVTLVDTHESFAPTSVEAFVADATLETQTAPNTCAAGVRPTAVVRVTATRPEWMRFAGTWGEYQSFHGPNPINTVVSGFSPASPPAGTLWQHPVQTVLGWPRSGWHTGAFGSGSRSERLPLLVMFRLAGADGIRRYRTPTGSAAGRPSSPPTPRRQARSLQRDGGGSDWASRESRGGDPSLALRAGSRPVRALRMRSGAETRSTR